MSEFHIVLFLCCCALLPLIYYYYHYYYIIISYHFMHVIYNYTPETDHVSKVHSVAVVLYLQFVLHVILFPPDYS